MTSKTTSSVVIGAISIFVISVALGKSPFPTRAPETCADARQIDRRSTLAVNNLLQNLASNSTFFSVFSVALDKPCPLWRDEEAKCVIRECTVKNCREDEVPEAWRDQQGKPCVRSHQKRDDPLNNVDRRLTGLAALVGQPLWYTADDDAWTVRDDERDSVYVDLRRNPEQYTGYAGPGSQRVWKAIYDENCFIFSDKCRTGICDSDTCKEERVLYSLISGLHSSISMHIAKRYLLGSVWGPNVTIYKERLRPYPERIQNLNLAYAVAMRALAKASTALSSQNYTYVTGNEANDRFTQQQVDRLFQLHLLQPHCEHKTFDESDMFLKQNKYMLPYFRGAFRNISMIMDCVGCEKCRVWGKLQFLGLGTALRVLFEEKTPELERNEVIALFNVLYKLSTSVLWVDKMEHMIRREARIKAKFGAALGFFAVAIISIIAHNSTKKGATSTTAPKQDADRTQTPKDSDDTSSSDTTSQTPISADNGSSRPEKSPQGLRKRANTTSHS
ncbi:Endoplasmic reticulum oxidoreductin-2 [Gracilariopsis chorda]|uniref:Endoplasmic reticulum oxidoreductin-2 n=1 Tax=Gracilariopsis chorda TaxID=448386 RepID=A0A2V3IWS7_9FLOR|nr:Endoplasmic reticulum oxidoreductin-2 [Gracilariopsis chorda]|eukprot:PXF46571.1 Endoplasmic reticulum oxidoreductin-2 [Gracilariopsis chorda]